MRRRHAGLVLLSVLATACGPQTDVNVGLKDYNTDVVYGAKKKPAPPAPVGGATLDPGFPGFIQPPPARIGVVLAGPDAPAPAPPVVKPSKCPSASVHAIPPVAAVDITKAPAPGVYRYRNSGHNKVGDKSTRVADESTRAVEVTSADPRLPAWRVSIASGTAVTSTSYAVHRPLVGSGLDGIYITQVVMRDEGSAPQEFTPSGLGLRVMPFPAELAKTWDSVATDPLHGTSMRLTGALTEKRRVDACGDLVEGWTSSVSVQILGATEGGKDLKVEAVYVIAPQLGGLIVADNVKMTGTDANVAIEQHVDSIIRTLKPEHPG